MRVLIVGAGASYAESLALGAERSLQMPLVKNFSQQLWSEFHPGQSLLDFLSSKGVAFEPDNSMEIFNLFEREGSREINVETYFEFLWARRERYYTQYGFDWDNILYHGVLNPLLLRMATVFHENGVGWRKFPVSDVVAGRLRPNDLVLNLNYDTVFDIALSRTHTNRLCYLPNRIDGKSILVAKPHGSLNLLVTSKGFSFMSPENTGAGAPKGAGFHFGLFPPRQNKDYKQHELAKRILEATPRCPAITVTTFWGVGLTASDVDLLELYKHWATSSDLVEAINPSKKDVDHISECLGVPVTRFESVDTWTAAGT